MFQNDFSIVLHFSLNSKKKANIVIPIYLLLFSVLHKIVYFYTLLCMHCSSYTAANNFTSADHLMLV